MRHSFSIIIFCIIAFLLGKFFGESRVQEAQRVDPPRVFIEQLKTKMNITKNRDDIEIFLNGKKMTEDIKINVAR